MHTTWWIEHRNVRTHRAACDDPRVFALRAERLRQLGERGEVVLIEAASGLVLARRILPAAVPGGHQMAGPDGNRVD